MVCMQDLKKQPIKQPEFDGFSGFGALDNEGSLMLEGGEYIEEYVGSILGKK